MSLLCSRLLETVLGYISAVVSQSVERNADKLTGKFYIALLSRAYDLLTRWAFISLPSSVFCCCAMSLSSSLSESFTLRIKLVIPSFNRVQLSFFLEKNLMPGDHFIWKTVAYLLIVRSYLSKFKALALNVESYPISMMFQFIQVEQMITY